MFTGLIQHVGVVERVVSGAVTDVWVRGADTDLVHGESIACDGVCLTVVEFKGASFRVQAAPETLRRTTLGEWRQGTRVNLERALRLGDRLGGHWVQGHVDGVGTLLEHRPEGGTRALTFSIPTPLSPFFVEKGSVCIDGISLTVTHASAETFGVMLIPETLEHTSLGDKAIGAKVNLETDVIGKYVARMLAPRGGLSEETLRAAGFLGG